LADLVDNVAPVAPSVRATADAAELFAYERSVAEARAGPCFRLVARRPRREEFRYALLEMKTQLVVDVGTDVAANKAEIAAPARFLVHLGPPRITRAARACS
jgi:hypothetical protein